MELSHDLPFLDSAVMEWLGESSHIFQKTLIQNGRSEYLGPQPGWNSERGNEHKRIRFFWQPLGTSNLENCPDLFL
jgi:hypothetical protein